MSTPKIYSSVKYDEFDTIIGNRVISEKKIDLIIKDIKKGINLLPYAPIIVYLKGEKLMIVDGQHRFNVSKKLEMPVYYVVAEALELKQIAMLNSRQDKWKPTDFLKCYIKIGIEDYKILDEVLKEFEVGLSTTCEFLMYGDKMQHRRESSQKFRDGEFKVNFLEETKALFKLSHSLFDRYRFYRDRNLIEAVQRLQKKGLCDFERLKEKINLGPNEMDKQTSVKNYMYNIERVYNYKDSIRKVII